MLVDPTILRAFAGQVEEASTTVATTDLAGKIETSFDGLQGSSSQWVAKHAGSILRGLLDTFSTDVAAMGTAVRGAADTYEVTDADLAASFRELYTENPNSDGLPWSK